MKIQVRSIHDLLFKAGTLSLYSHPVVSLAVFCLFLEQSDIAKRIFPFLLYGSQCPENIIFKVKQVCLR